MLVLTRRKGESIMIGSDVSVTILDVRGDQVRVGIDAPRSVKVHREEVYQQVAAANQAAASPSTAARALLQQRLRNAGQARPSEGDGAETGRSED